MGIVGTASSASPRPLISLVLAAASCLPIRERSDHSGPSSDLADDPLEWVAYFEQGMSDIAVFELYVRRMPTRRSRTGQQAPQSADECSPLLPEWRDRARGVVRKQSGASRLSHAPRRGDGCSLGFQPSCLQSLASRLRRLNCLSGIPVKDMGSITYASTTGSAEIRCRVSLDGLMPIKAHPVPQG